MEGCASPPLLLHYLHVGSFSGGGDKVLEVGVVAGEVCCACGGIPNNAVLAPILPKYAVEFFVCFVHPQPGGEERALSAASVVFDEAVFHCVEGFDLRGFVALCEVVEEAAVCVCAYGDAFWVAGDYQDPPLRGVRVHVCGLKEATEEHVYLFGGGECPCGAFLACEHVVTPIKKNGSEVGGCSGCGVFGSTGEGFHFGEHVFEVQVSVHVVDVGEEVEPVDECAGEFGGAFGGCYVVVEPEVQETAHGVCGENEALVLVADEQDVGHDFPGSLKLLEVEDHLPQHVADGEFGLEVLVELGFKQKPYSPPCRVSVRAVGRSPLCLRSVVGHFCAVCVFDVFFDASRGQGGLGVLSHERSYTVRGFI